MKREDIFAAISTERERQEDIHPGWPWEHEMYLRCMEEVMG